MSFGYNDPVRNSTSSMQHKLPVRKLMLIAASTIAVVAVLWAFFSLTVAGRNEVTITYDRGIIGGSGFNSVIAEESGLSVKGPFNRAYTVPSNKIRMNINKSFEVATKDGKGLTITLELALKPEFTGKTPEGRKKVIEFDEEFGMTPVKVGDDTKKAHDGLEAFQAFVDQRTDAIIASQVNAKFRTLNCVQVYSRCEKITPQDFDGDRTPLALIELEKQVKSVVQDAMDTKIGKYVSISQISVRKPKGDEKTEELISASIGNESKVTKAQSDGRARIEAAKADKEAASIRAQARKIEMEPCLGTKRSEACFAVAAQKAAEKGVTPAGIPMATSGR